MRHRVAHRKLGRVTEHRIALLRNQAQALLRHERIETTVPKAKELRPFVERLITIAKRGVAASEPNGRTLHARRLLARDLSDNEVVGKLFEVLAPRYAARAGGYTRLLKIGFRRGDAAEVAQVELVGSEYNPKAAEGGEGKAAAKAKGKGVGGRLRAAAERIRGKKGAEEEGAAPGAEQKTQTPKHVPGRRQPGGARRATGK